MIKNLARILKVLIITIWTAVCLLPIYFLLSTSFKTEADYGANGIFPFPRKYIFSNYPDALMHQSFLTYFKNSTIILVCSLSLLLIIALLASYAFSRLMFKWNRPLHSFVVACMAVPIHSVLISVYLLTRDIGLYDNIYGLIGPYVAFNLPITIFILTSFMRDIPREMEESAEIDGCGKLQSFFSIIVPLSKAGIVTVAIYDGIGMWNEFTFVLILTESSKNHTLPFSLWTYLGMFSNNVPMLFTVLVLSVIPMVIAFAIGQDKLVKGMMAGALKG